MYSPIPEVENPLDGEQHHRYTKEHADRAQPSLHDDNTRKEDKALRHLTIVIWTVSALFGLFAAVHYVVRMPPHRSWEDSWEATDPGLYRTGRPWANGLMLAHLIGGSFLMLAGPIQLLPTMRRRFLAAHRWIGRFYIGAAMVTSACATMFCLVFGNARHNVHENIGMSFLECAP